MVRPLKYGEETDHVHTTLPRSAYNAAKRYGKILGRTVPHVCVMAIRALMAEEPAALRALKAEKRAEDLDRELLRIAGNLQREIEDLKAKNRQLRDKARVWTFRRLELAELLVRRVPETVQERPDFKRLLRLLTEDIPRDIDPRLEAEDLAKRYRESRPAP